MRIRLRIDRPGDIPTVKILWNTDGLRLSASSTTTSSRVADLLRDIDEVIPLRLGDNWGLEDYVVEVQGFECLHFCHVEQFFSENELVTIRPKSLQDVRARKIAGRDQISAGGIRLYDGVPWDRPFIRAASRPTIEPPRKLLRFSPEIEPDENLVMSSDAYGVSNTTTILAEGNKTSTAHFHSNHSSANLSVHDLIPAGTGGILSTIRATSRKLGQSSASVPTTGRTDGRKIVKSVLKRSPQRRLKTVRFADNTTGITKVHPIDESGSSIEPFNRSESDQAGAPSTTLELQIRETDDDDEDEDYDDDDDDDDDEDEDDSDSIGSDWTSSSGSNFSNSDAESESVSGSDADTDTDSRASSASDQSPKRPFAKLDVNVTAPITCIANVEKLHGKTSNQCVAPGSGLTRTRKRNERKTWSKKLSKLKDLGILPRDAGIPQCRDFFDKTDPSEYDRKIAAAFEERRKLLLDSLSNEGVEIPDIHSPTSTEPTKTQPTRPETTLDLPRSLAASAKASPGLSDPSAQHQAKSAESSLLDGSWGDRINLNAVECCYERGAYAAPPFPFIQRWHRTRRSKKELTSARTKKRKHGDIEDADVILNYGCDNELCAPRGENLEDGPANERVAKDCLLAESVDNLLVLPDITTLPPLEQSLTLPGAIIAFKELEVSEATHWAPQISSHKTATVSEICEDGTIVLHVAPPDQRTAIKKFDDHTGQRIYSRFEGPDMSDEEEDILAQRTLTFEELIEPLLVSPAKDAARNHEVLMDRALATPEGTNRRAMESNNSGSQAQPHTEP